MGGVSSQLKFGSRIPAPIMLVGLQGCGKTTTAVKLARLVAGQGKRVYLASADVYRPAAAEQLKVLGGASAPGYLTRPVRRMRWGFASRRWKRPGAAVTRSSSSTRREGWPSIQMMDELKRIKALINPSEILLMADAAMTGRPGFRGGSSTNSGDRRGGTERRWTGMPAVVRPCRLEATIGKPTGSVRRCRREDRCLGDIPSPSAWRHGSSASVMCSPSSRRRRRR